MNITISRIELTNFKCFRHKELTFDSDVTTIRGRNGVGKTTIADAILWTLFGKNAAGQATFDLKTHGADGKPIPNLDHSVEMSLTVPGGSPAGKEITLKRTLKETWVKKRGSEEQVFKNNTTEYFVNGEAFTAKDYEKYISSLIPEETFRSITNPNYFPSLKWQVQRDLLTKMAGEITEEDFAKEGDDSELYQFRQMLAESDEDIIAYRKHLSYQIKQIKDKLDRIPVRLEEQNKALPESLDYDALEQQCADVLRQQKAVDEKIIAIRSGNGGDVLRAEIRNEIEHIRRDMNDIEDKERISFRIRQTEHDGKVAEASRQFNQLLLNQKDIEASIPSFDNMIARCRETLNQCEADAQAIREEWANNLSRTLHFHDADGVCPTCGQYLPEDQIAEKRKKAEENLNADKARVKQALTERANKVKALRADAGDKIKELEAKKEEAQKNLADTKALINQVFSDKAVIEKSPVLSLEEALAANTQYQELLQARDELHKKLDSVGVDEEDENQLSELISKKSECNEILSRCHSLLATRDMRQKILALIAGINDEQRTLIAQLSELERREDIARRYQDRQNQILEARINGMFSLVKWRMFRTVNNGGEPFDEPFCECYVDGVAYHDGLNQAARLNAGLDIINTLCRHYNVSAPIILDNSESTINILPTIGQQVRLQVSDCDLQLL